MAISPSGIAATSALGSPSVSGVIGPSGIASTSALGAPIVLKQTTNAFTFFIDGVNVSRYVLDPSLNISMQMGGRATASFTIIPKGGVSYEPVLHKEIIIHHNPSGTRMFGGQIASLSKKVVSGTSGFYTIQVSCTDFGILLDRRVIAKWYTMFLGSYIPIICRDIVDKYLIGTGITYDGHLFGPSYVGDDIIFNWLTIAEAFNQMASATGSNWFITPYKELRWVGISNGTPRLAPFSIEQNDGNWMEMTEERTRLGHYNRVYVRNSQDVAALWTDTTEITGGRLFFTTYPQEVAPVVMIGGEEQTICSLAEVGSTPGWQFYYIPGVPGISHNQNLPELTSGTMEIIYPSRVSAAAKAEDLAAIAADGLSEHIEEVKDILSAQTLQSFADGALERGKTIARDIVIETRRAGLEPAQELQVNANGVTGTFIIKQVDIREIAKGVPHWTVKASSTTHRTGAGAAFFAAIKQSQRQPVDRVDSNISFVLAETIEGYDNPGLTTGVKEAMRTARKTGYAKIARLHFNSVANTPTETEIEIDMLKNGVSIFGGSQKMIYPAGANAVQTKFYFAENPLLIEAGDIFTIEVLSADENAKDGFFELQVQG